jgi:tRNA (cmo5U34)-methyltransferase
MEPSVAADDVDTNAAIWKSEAVVKGLVEQGAERERQRAEQLTLMARLLGFEPNAAFTFLDLGAGTGAATRAILTEYPNASAILAEYSPPMIAEGTQLLARFASRFRYVEFDLLSPDWPRDIPVPLDAAVSALSIHHLPDARKQSLFRDIRDRLRPGAWYLNFDPIRGPSASLEAVWQHVNDRYDPEAPTKRAHRTAQEQARWENHVRYMIPLEPQLRWLQEAGFVDIDVYWKRLDWVIYGGRTPA